jgi:hypothetical protein
VIIFVGTGGRLGNQVFQTAFLERIRKKNEIVLTTNMGEAEKLFLGLRKYFNTNRYVIRRVADKIFHPFLQDFLVRFRLVSGYIEVDEVLKITQGILPVTYCRGYFQSDKFLCTSGLMRSRIRKRLLNSAQELLTAAGSRMPLFVHVRRGDHATPGIQGNYMPLLPSVFYRSCIERLAREVARPHFFFLGDDPDWCEKEFGSLPNKTIVRRSPYEDMTLMTLCDGGVVSNSSFAWCGAYLCRRSAPIYAPRFWLGWSKRQWHPRSVEYDGFCFVDVHELLRLDPHKGVGFE